MYTFSREIISQLNSIGIIPYSETLRKHEHQGFMSEVFEVDSSYGTLILHKTHITDGHRFEDLHLKYLIIKEWLELRRNDLLPHYIYSKIEDKNHILIQKKIQGYPAGKREIREDTIIDSFGDQNSSRYFEELEILLAHIHHETYTTGGYISKLGDSIEGSEPSWKEYLKKYVLVWGDACNLTQISLGNVQFVIESLPDNSKSVLVHGDAINPGNILIQNDTIVGIVDWEWAIIADPAWEFADLGWRDVIKNIGLTSYFMACNITSKSEKDNFLDRIKKYRILWLLWGASIHAKEIDSPLYTILITEFHNELDTFIFTNK